MCLCIYMCLHAGKEVGEAYCMHTEFVRHSCFAKNSMCLWIIIKKRKGFA